MSRSGQNRSNSKVGSSDKNWCHLIPFFYSEFIGAIFIPVGGLQSSQNWIREIGVCYFNSFLDFLAIK